ncbi:hypothetical protein MHD_10265 [Mannheimia granulomatis]|uniref:Mu-like prophage protein gp36 n=1 Tax=Mannheimia granulomatis TaxID=85402 RepID=A0A011P6Z4_9PAST|nr:DUF1320 domain-containing protein [Mannheimia granulomatis]EXI62224.1 hypothetical protein AK33_05730 [Mannheimia granulomatis]RGE47346.1 hypothetical protein MHD_10265 [Mannheimia granulomatis]
MYITTADLTQAFSKTTIVQLSNDDHRATEPNDAVLQQAVQSAGERIDSALRSRYRLPLSEVPTLIRDHGLYLARYWLYARRPGTAMPKEVKETYTQAIKELEQIAKGALHLGLAPNQPLNDKYGDLLPDQGEYRVKAGRRIDTEGY